MKQSPGTPVLVGVYIPGTDNRQENHSNGLFSNIVVFWGWGGIRVGCANRELGKVHVGLNRMLKEGFLSFLLYGTKEKPNCRNRKQASACQRLEAEEGLTTKAQDGIFRGMETLS